MPSFTLEQIEQELQRREELPKISPKGFNLEEIQEELMKRGAIPTPPEPERFARTKAFLKKIKIPTPPKETPPIDSERFKAIWGFEPIQDIKPPEKPTAMTMLTKAVGVGGGRPEIREPYPKTLTDRIKEVISKPFVRTKEEEIARSQNIYAISKELNLPLRTVRKNYTQLVKTLGLRDYPTTGELMGGMLIMPITAGLMMHPATTILGITGFMGLSEIESAVISKIKGEPYKFLQTKGLKDLLPEEANQYTSDTVEVLDFIGKGLILGGIYKKAPKIAEKFTKNIITEYKMPKKVYISPEKVSSIFKTGEKISPQELELIKDLGLSGKQYRNATMKGISIEVPAEKIVTIADKPYFSQIKQVLRLKPYKEVRTFRAGKPAEVIPEGRLLPAPTKVPEPVMKVAKPEVAKSPVTVPTAKAKIPEVVSISGLAKIKSHVETQLGRELIEREEKAIDTLDEGEDYVINDELIITHKDGTLADFEIRDVDAVRQATVSFLAKERKESLEATDEITFYQAVRRLGGAASYKKGMPGALREEYNTIVPIHCRKGEPKGGRPLDELASAFSEEYPQFGIENEKDLLEAFKNEKMARMNRVTEVYGRPIADKAKELIFGKKPIEAVQKTLFGPEEKVPAKVKPTKAIPGQPELPFGARPKFEMPVKPEVTAEKLGINVTPAGEKLLEEASPITLEFIDWFKKTKPQYIDSAKLSTYTDGEPYFFLPGVERAKISLKDFIKAQEVKPKVAPPRIEKAPPKTAIPPREPVPTEEVSKVKRSEIAKMISEKLDLPIRIGHFRHRAKGIYKVKPKIVRLKAPTDIETACHEVGHHIQNELNPELSKYSGELIALVKDFPTSHRNKKEGFAEFIRLYVTDPDSATKLLPELSKYFDNFISNYPEVEEVLLNARKDYDRWLKLPATARILSHISPTPEKATMPSIQRLYSLAIDELYPLKKYVDIVKKKKIKVFEQDDPFILATAHRGWHGKADAFLRYKTFDTNFNWTGSPLSDIYRPIGEAKALDEFDAFLVARRTLELKRRGIKTGIYPEDARRTLIELRRKYPFFLKKAEELYEYQSRILEYARDSELISPETCSKMKGLNKYYVPFYRVMEIAGRKGLLGKGVVNLPNIFKQIRGSEREIIRPSESIVKNTYAIIDAAERNQVGLALVKLAEKHPQDLGRVVEKLPPTMARIAEISINELTRELRQQNIEIPDDIAKEVINIFRPSIFKPARNIVTVMQKGKRTFYQVDPDIYNALTSSDRESMNILLKLLSYPARWLRLGAVALSPEFVVRNPVRDAFTAFCFSKGGFIPGLDTMRGLWSTLGQDENYWKWKISGGEHSMLVSLDREYLQKNIRDLIATSSAKLENVIKHPLENARILAEIGEEVTRLGEYRLVLGGGKRWFLMAERVPKNLPLKSKMLKAGIAAREVTLDFARSGAKTRAVNSITAFWNANVQDLDKVARSFKDNPIRTLYKVLAGITLPSILLWFANKDDPRYKEIPQWQKDIFWIIIPSEKARKREREMLPEGKRLPERPIWRIPKPFTLGLLFGTVPERILERTYNENPEAFKGLWDSISRGVNPGVIPTALLAPLEAITNYSFFLDRPVVSLGLKRLLPEMQHSIYTTEISKIIGKGLKVSPSKIDYFVRGYFGALGRYGLETVDQILKGTGIVHPPKGPKSTLADVPLVRAFAVREPVGSASQALNEFYELYEKSLQAEATIKELKKQKNDPLAEKYKIAHPGYRFATGFRGIGAYLSAMRRKRIRIWESRILSPEEKSKQILEIETKMTRKVREFLNKYESRLREQQ